ncbi:hypothetical protein MTO96_032568 [Rhipicephalus appendiculatus]
MSNSYAKLCTGVRGLRKLKVCLYEFVAKAPLSFVPAFAQLNQLQELELRRVRFDRATLRDLSEFLTSTRSLTTLDVTYQSFMGEDAVILIQGLERNETITTLSINASVQGSHSMFTHYLRLNQTLRTLNVASNCCSDLTDLRPTMGALFHNNHLSELNLISFGLDCEQNELITCMLIQNGNLRRLHMVGCYIYESDYSDHDHSVVKPTYFAFRNEASLMSLWLVALLENKTLNELTLDMTLWTQLDDYKLFFQALARNTSLKKVNVPQFKYEHVADICRAVREAGVQGTRLPRRASHLEGSHSRAPGMQGGVLHLLKTVGTFPMTSRCAPPCASCRCAIT